MSRDVFYFESEWNGAPVLSGTAGSRIDVLSGCLVTGFNSKTLTSLTRNSTVATAQCAGHGFAQHAVITVAGVNEAGWNGNWRISSVATDSFTFTVPDTLSATTTGTITAKVAAAGWTKPHSGTNKAGYLTGGSNPRNLRLSDSNNLYARAVGYESMTDVDTGSGPFPTEAQVTGGLYIYGSDTASAAGRRWRMIATEDFGLMLSEFAPAQYPGQFDVFAFGRFPSFAAGDAFNWLIAGTYGTQSLPGNNNQFRNINSAAAGHYLARSMTQQGGSVAWQKAGSAISSSMGSSGTLYPARTDLGLRLAMIYVMESSPFEDRGPLSGIYQPTQNLFSAQLSSPTIFDDIDDLPGRRILAVQIDSSSRMLIDITGPWD